MAWMPTRSLDSLGVVGRATHDQSSRGPSPSVELSVLVPTRNESANVGPMVEQLRRALQGITCEIIFVDDSDDETPDAMARRLDTARAELAAQDDFDKVVVNSELESACSELVSLLVGRD